jgi:hypothetical protein
MRRALIAIDECPDATHDNQHNRQKPDRSMCRTENPDGIKHR